MQRGSGTDVAVVDDEQIIRLYRDQCHTAAEVSVELGCSPSTVYFRLARLGIARRPARPRHSARPADSGFATSISPKATAFARSPGSSGSPRRPSEGGSSTPGSPSADLARPRRAGRRRIWSLATWPEPRPVKLPTTWAARPPASTARSTTPASLADGSSPASGARRSSKGSTRDSPPPRSPPNTPSASPASAAPWPATASPPPDRRPANRSHRASPRIAHPAAISSSDKGTTRHAGTALNRRPSA